MIGRFLSCSRRREQASPFSVARFVSSAERPLPRPADFVYGMSRDFARSCQTPMLVMPDDTPAQPDQTSIEIASLAPNAEATVYPWREPRS